MKVNRPRSNGSVQLYSPCRTCGYGRGLVIIRFDNDLGFVRCGQCDAALYSQAEQQAREVVA